MSVMPEAADTPSEIRAEKIPAGSATQSEKQANLPTPLCCLHQLTAEELRVLFPLPPRKASCPQVLVSPEGTAPVSVV